MDTDRGFIWSDMVFEKWENMEMFKLFVGREKKGQVALRRLFFRAAEGVGKTGTEWLPMRTGEMCRKGSIGVEGFYDFRRGLGLQAITYNYLFYGKYISLYGN